ncbi:MAG: hypothetical protein WBG50_19235 [Desulfomonilaceae bacterium]
MTLFSERTGIKPAHKAIQRKSIDEPLRNRLWSAISIVVWDRWQERDPYGMGDPDTKYVESLIDSFWLNYYKLPIDERPGFKRRYGDSAYDILRNSFFNGEWWEVYDYLEFVMTSVPDRWKGELRKVANNFLQAESSAYRIVEDKIVEISSETEIAEIETALDQSLSSVTVHLGTALDLLSDRKNPNYRNSIKESISAVEAACRAIARKEKATLADCLKSLKDRQPLHPAFEQALSKLYAYTSDADGIRHALANGATSPSYGDAKFMLVSCSAFINYLWTKATELGIALD